MIGGLPKSLVINDEIYKIDSDFRTIMLILDMYNDRDMSDMYKHMTMLEIIFTTKDSDGNLSTNIPNDTKAAIEEVFLFINMNNKDKTSINESDGNSFKSSKRVIDYRKDQHLLFSAVNAVYNGELRSEDYIHWWTFFGLCQAIDGESMISFIMSIRSKLNNNENLSDSEREFLANNRDLIIIDDISFEEEYENMANDLRELRDTNKEHKVTHNKNSELPNNNSEVKKDEYDMSKLDVNIGVNMSEAIESLKMQVNHGNTESEINIDK